jgi:GDP-D-mannose 3',5'-epimerase
MSAKCSTLVCRAGGFIGGHPVKQFKKERGWVRGVDWKYHEFCESLADERVIGNLRDPQVCRGILDRAFDEVCQLAADMGEAGYILTGDHACDVMHNAGMNMVDFCGKAGVAKVFYSSSGRVYAGHNQRDPSNPRCSEDSANPAAPDSEYGWEKLFSERMCVAYHRNFGLNLRVARFHNTFGPEGSWNNGKEKAPATSRRDGDDLCLDRETGEEKQTIGLSHHAGP